MSRNAFSLRGRLIRIVFATTVLLWSAAGLTSYYTALREVGTVLDGQMIQAAKLLLAQVHHEEKELYEAGMVTQVLEKITLHPYEQAVQFQVWDRAGKLILRSANAPPMAMAARRGFTDFDQAGAVWRVFSINADDSDYQVQVAQEVNERHETALTVATQSALPMLLALPMLAALTYWSVRRGLRPLERLAADVAARDPEHLEALTEADAPREARPLVVAVNALLARLDTALHNERRFTADAAHELRTPLAAIKLHTQLAQTCQDDATRRHALDQVLVGTERAVRLVEQLLRLARLDPLKGLADPRPIDLQALLASVAEAARPAAVAAGLELELVTPAAPVTLSGDIDMLALALRNLLENATRYTPAGGRVTLGAAATDADTRIWVSDTGPGAAEDELANLVERFYRGRDVTVEGSGLGLAIVRRVVELHEATLTLGNRPEGGFQAILRFPPTACLATAALRS